VTSQTLGSIMLPWLGIPATQEPPPSLPGTRHTELTVETGMGGGQKDVDKQIKDVQETAQSYDQNVPGTIMLEHTTR